MAIKYESVVPWGRSYEEYLDMFSLSKDDLNKSILGCGDGPASFNCVMNKNGKHAVSIDPIYQLSINEIQNRINDTYDTVISQTKMNIEDKMSLTIDLADKVLKKGEMPISAYVFLDDEVVSKAYTSEIADKKLLIHAELKALLAADDQKFSIAERKKMQLFTTLEPCMMCYGTAMSSFIGEIYFSLKAPEDGITALISFNNFSGSFIKRQIPKNARQHSCV
jgi:tRNA(Arg) A34 adenosine deaminase TadA